MDIKNKTKIVCFPVDITGLKVTPKTTANLLENTKNMPKVVLKSDNWEQDDEMIIIWNDVGKPQEKSNV